MNPGIQTLAAVFLHCFGKMESNHLRPFSHAEEPKMISQGMGRPWRFKWKNCSAWPFRGTVMEATWRMDFRDKAERAVRRLLL